MEALLWFFVGSVVSLLTARALRRGPTHPRALATTPAPPEPAEPAAPAAPASVRYVLEDSRSLQELSEAVSVDLAELTSGVEGQAQLLCENMGNPRAVAERADQLWESVRRLRFLCEKLSAFATAAELQLEPTNIRLLLAALSHEVQDYARGGLQVELSVAPSLPFAMANAAALRVAILFLIEAVMQLEADAGSLLIQARAHEDEEDETDTLGVRIEIEAVLQDSATRTGKAGPQVHFSCLAARNLLKAQNAAFTLDHTQGLHAIASLTLLATDQPVPETTIDEPTGSVTIPEAIEFAPALPETALPPQPHSFGGVLIVESNPSIRDMLAQELGKNGRNVVVCADGVAARTLFEATPERFELLIVERDSRRFPGEELARLALEQAPGLRVLMIHAETGIATAPELAARPELSVLEKPFGLMELRDQLGNALAPHPPHESA